MDKCICTQEAAVSFLKTKVKDFDRDLNGNGKDGLKKEVHTLKIEHESEMKDLAKMSKSLETLASKQANREAVLKFVGRAIIVGSTILGGSAALVAIIIAFADKTP